jgi:LacI family transcriptional regulator
VLLLVRDITNPFYLEVYRGVEEAAFESGYKVLMGDARMDDARTLHYVDMVRQRHADGLILMTGRLPAALTAADCAYVRITYTALDDPSRLVISNDRLAVAEVANYLTSLGHKRIGYIAGPSGFRSAIERLAGFRDALAARSISFPEELIVEGGYTYESGVAGGEKLLSLNPRPTAIFASNDEMAAGVYRVANKLGLSIPGDLSIVGFDDGPLAARLLPSLTTIRLPIRELGRLAANKILHPEAAGGTHAMVTPLEPHLVIRDSCQPPSR